MRHQHLVDASRVIYNTLTARTLHSYASHRLYTRTATSLAGVTVARTNIHKHLTTPALPTIPSLPVCEDRLLLIGLSFYSRHGVYEYERMNGQKFVIDCIVHTDLHAAALSASLPNTVNYGAVFDRISHVMTDGGQFVLLEELAYHIINDLMTTFTAITAVQVTVKKPHVSVAGIIDYLGIAITRNREQWQTSIKDYIHITQDKKEIKELNK